tara:strand:- start:445 stop:1164 length:720 start_codon:yes stop_codon:yes gene_type:complete
MPTYSDAIADGDFTNEQRPTPQLKRPKRPREFWEVEPGQPGTEGWRDDPDHPTDAQLGSIANTNPNPTPPRATDPTTAQPQQSPVAAQPPVTITPETAAPVKDRVDNPKWTEYTQFVDAVTSNESKNGAQFISRIAQLQGSGCNIERLLTAAVGISAEGGEFMEIVKKIAFQGKPYDEANINHLRVELGDVLWYVAQACIALDVSLDDVIGQNITKLAARYPEGTFSTYFSENRRIDDL